MPLSGFRFVQLEPDPELQTRASLRLYEILAMGPMDAYAQGTIERARDYYVARVELQSKYLNLVEKAAGLTADTATERVLSRLEDALYDWRNSSEKRKDPGQCGMASPVQASLRHGAELSNLAGRNTRAA